jgi:DNA-binding PadR family transcriptional regulator
VRTIPQQTTSLTTTEGVILGLLCERERSGYDLLKRAEGSVAHMWAPAKSQLYAVLPRLVDDGFANRRTVRQSARPDKQV